MTNEELTLYNIGENLDSLMTLDPRGYGVCRILYRAARDYAGEPLSVHAAKGLVAHIHSGDLVYIISGFVLLPWKQPETDGMVSSMMLARFLIKAFDCTPVLVVPEECMEAVRRLAMVLGFHLYDTVEEAREYPFSMCAVPFTKDDREAPAQAEALLAKGVPAAVITNEAPGRNAKGAYHNAVGKCLTELEAKSDVLFNACKARGIYNLSIGDLGNEIGMAAIGDHIRKYVPHADDGECECSCGGGILVESTADNLITATCSDWGCNAMMAATAYLLGNADLFQSEEVQQRAMEEAARAGLLDMYGRNIPSIDGFGRSINLPLVKLMKELISYPPKVVQKTSGWFADTIAKGYFDGYYGE